MKHQLLSVEVQKFVHIASDGNTLAIDEDDMASVGGSPGVRQRCIALIVVSQANTFQPALNGNILRVDQGKNLE